MADTPKDLLRSAIQLQRETVRAELVVLRELEASYQRMGGSLDDIGEVPAELRIPIGEGPPNAPKRKQWTPEQRANQSKIMAAWHASKKKAPAKKAR